VTTYRWRATLTTTHGPRFTVDLEFDSLDPNNALRELSRAFDAAGGGYFAAPGVGRSVAGPDLVAVRVSTIIGIEMERRP
jgi:hypothetical protein